jgi:orotate phosphoribosyltransferase
MCRLDSSAGLRAELLALLRNRSYEQKEVTLASGRKSDFYVDGKQTSLHPRGAYLLGKLLLEMLPRFGEVDAIGGPTLGADPLATSVALVSSIEGRPLPAFIVRKEPKGHGTKRWIEGQKNLAPGMRVVVIEDVVTTGGSGLQAVEKIEAEGYKVVGLLAVVDREEGAREAIEKAGYRFESLFTKTEIRG